MICINLNTLYHCIFKIFLSLHFFTAMHCLAYHNHFILFQFSYQNFSWLFSLFHKFIDQTIQVCRNGGVRGAIRPPYFSRQLTQSKPVGRLCPPNYYSPQIFRPSYGPAIYSLINHRAHVS